MTYPHKTMPRTRAQVKAKAAGADDLPEEDRSPPGLAQSSIPGMSIANIRTVLGEQRRVFQRDSYVNMVDEVYDGMTRMEFNFRYVHGIALKRHAKHKRASHRGSAQEDQ